MTFCATKEEAKALRKKKKETHDIRQISSLQMESKSKR